MKAKFGALVVAGRGKINGWVASQNRAGAYFRTKTSPTNPQTPDQMATRSLMGSLSQAWRNLTDTQRASWNAAVDNFQTTDVFGDLKTPSGFNLFMRLNRNLQTGAASTLTEAPEVISPEPLTTFTAVADESSNNIILTFAPTPVPARHVLIVEGTPVVSPGRSFVKNRYRGLAHYASSTATGQDLAGAWIAKFGTFEENDVFFLRAKLMHIDSGLQTPYTVYKVVVQA